MSFSLALDRSRPGPLVGDGDCDTGDALSKIEHRLVDLPRTFGIHSPAWRSFVRIEQRNGMHWTHGPPFRIP